MLTEAAAVASAGSSSAWLVAVCAADFHRDFEPIVTQFGYDPIWFVISVGVVMVEDGSIHPPVGMNLFVVQAQAPRCKITSIHCGIIPFLIAPLMPIVLMFLFPSLGGCWTCFTPAASSRALEACPDSALGS